MRSIDTHAVNLVVIDLLTVPLLLVLNERCSGLASGTE